MLGEQVPRLIIVTPLQARSERFVFIDALRGIAAVAVLCFHMRTTVMEAPLQRIVPGFLTTLNEYGALGVEIFFVLSGFVIAHSLRDNALNVPAVGNFILRRQLRLDPPYWLVILAVLGLHRVELMIPSLASEPMPTISDVFLNLLYLHPLLGAKPVIDVSWTLCVEIQFYLVFITLLYVGRLSARNQESGRDKLISAWLVFGLGCLSLTVIHFTGANAWFISYWFYFAAGALCYWTLQGQIRWMFLIFVILFGISAVVSFFSDLTREQLHMSGPAMVVGLLTCLLIYVVGCKGHLTDWWNNRVVQYFGRISYSLYLVHLVVLSIVLRVGYKITGENELLALVWVLVAASLSILAAHILYILVEKPSMKLASRLKSPPVHADTRLS